MRCYLSTVPDAKKGTDSTSKLPAHVAKLKNICTSPGQLRFPLYEVACGDSQLHFC